MKEIVPLSLTSYVLESGLRVMLVPNFHTWRLPGSSCLYNHYIALEITFFIFTEACKALVLFYLLSIPNEREREKKRGGGGVSAYR